MPPRKILAIKLRALGDTVLMTAPLMELRQAYPRSQIHALVLSPWAPILEPHPAINQVWAFERHADRGARARALARLAFRLRRERYDCVVNFHASPSSSLLAFATGAKIRSVHFHGHRAKNRYSTVPVPGKGTLKPVIERDMDTVRALGLQIPAGRLPWIPVTSEEQASAGRAIAAQGLCGPVLGLGLGASRATKSWPVERFAELAVRWCRDRGGSALAFTGPSEEELGRSFLAAVEPALSRGECTPEVRARIAVSQGKPIRETAAMLSALSAFAGNDSGPRHVAVAVGTPTVTLFGPEHPLEWHPYPTDRHPYLFQEGLPCRKDADPGMPAWCAVDPCIAEAHRCMTSIGADAVLEKCLEVAR